MNRPNLGDYHLHLDPELEGEIRALQSGPAIPAYSIWCSTRTGAPRSR